MGIDDDGGAGTVVAAGLTARGTQDGLVLRADGRTNREVLWESLRGFIQSRRSFVEGNQVIIEWVGDLPSDETVSFVRANVLRDFDIELINGGRAAVTSNDEGSEVRGSSSFHSQTSSGHSQASSGTQQSNGGGSSRGPSLFGGIEAALDRRAAESRGLESVAGGFAGNANAAGSVWGTEGDSGASSAGAGARSSGSRLGATPKVGWGAAVANWDDADARVVYGTLRSGQKVETEHSVLIFGDVNSGAEIVAGGDVVVLGNLRGVAHAGAYDETGGGRVIFALHLEPTQLRIGAVISRGMGGGSTPEIARVDGQSIVVEPYQAKGAPNSRKAA